MKERSPKHEGIVLENREVVGLVLGSLVVLGVVFYLGVSVGKGLAEEKAEPTRSLEMLDRQAEERMAVELTFAERLTEEAPAHEPAEDPEEEVVAKEEPPPAPREPEAAPAAAPAAPAEAKPAPPAAAPPEDAAEAAPSRFAVQLASFPSKEEADVFADRLREAGLSPRIVSAEIPGKGTYHRVRVGNFPSRDEANRFLDDLRREGRFDGIVMPADG